MEISRWGYDDISRAYTGLAGGFKHFLCSIINIGDNPSHWLIVLEMVKTTTQWLMVSTCFSHGPYFQPHHVGIHLWWWSPLDKHVWDGLKDCQGCSRMETTQTKCLDIFRCWENPTCQPWVNKPTKGCLIGVPIKYHIVTFCRVPHGTPVISKPWFINAGLTLHVVLQGFFHRLACSSSWFRYEKNTDQYYTCNIF